jgi:nitroreductase
MGKTKLIGGHPFVAYEKPAVTPEELRERSRRCRERMDTRRSIRDFAATPVAREVMEDLIRTASSAPSGAHKQPWTFCLVSDPALKKAIREAAEEEEFKSYHQRMPPDWLADLAPLQTDWKKPFLETAPWLVVVFKKSYEPKPDGSRGQVYYATESCGLACGFLLAAIQEAGLAALTHTPSPMDFLRRLLKRPEHEKPFLLIPVGYPATECWVPDLKRKSLEEVACWY